MKPSECLEVAEYVAASFPKANTTEAGLSVLVDQLRDLEYEPALAIVRGIVATERPFPPSPSEIRNAYFTALHRLPTVAEIVAAIVTARASGRVEDAEYPHPIVREVVLEVGPSRIHEEWGYTHRVVVESAERLRELLLRAVNLASLEGRPPDLHGRLALIASGLDPFQKPATPVLPEGWVFHGWSVRHAEGLWMGNATGPEAGQFVHLESTMLYASLDLAALPPGRPGRLALPAGSWTPPPVTTWGTTHRGPACPLRALPGPAASAARPRTPAEVEARRDEVLKIFKAPKENGGAA